MTRIYLYKDTLETVHDHSWQHETGILLLEKVKEDCPYSNVSHSGEYVAVAVSNTPVGVDVEKKNRSVSERLKERVLNEAEKEWINTQERPEDAFIQLWTLKEAYGKALRKGICYDMSEHVFIPEEYDKDGCIRVKTSGDNITVRTYYGDDYALSICVLGCDEEIIFENCPDCISKVLPKF